jgi:magnesium transporter
MQVLSILKHSDQKLEIIPDLREGCWVNLINPDPAQLAYISEALHIPLDFLLSPLDEDERARTEKDDDLILIILRVPYFQGQDSDIPYITVPLGIILTAHHILTVCKFKHPLIEGFMTGQKKGFSTAKKYRFVLQLLLQTAKDFLAYLRDIDHQVDVVEAKLEVSQQNRELLELLKYQKSLVYFTVALRSNELMMERLQRSRLFHMYPDDEELLEDVLIEIRQAMEMVSISSNILSTMTDTFATVISNNLNVVMKLLALLTILMSIPTITASIFGMNVNLPLQEHPLAFWGIGVLSTTISLAVAFYFRSKHWF